jgi:hypothetical protein
LTTAIGAGQTVSNISSGGTLTVTSTTGFPTSGTITVSTSLGWQNVAYTNTSGSTFTGCTGGTGAPIGGNLVAAGSSAQGTLVATYVREFVFYKDTNLVNASVFYICADKVGEITQLFSTLAGYTGYGGAGRAATTTNAGSVSLPQTTLVVTSVAGFPSSGSINVVSSGGDQTVTYSGTQTSPSIAFTGCTGGTGAIINGCTVSSNGVAASYAPQSLANGIPPGFGGLNNTLNTVSPKAICVRGTSGSNAAVPILMASSNFQTNAQIACVNAIPSSGVSADGSFYLVVTNTAVAGTACMIQYTAVDNSEPGDLDPYVFYTPMGNPYTFSVWNNSQTTGTDGATYIYGFNIYGSSSTGIAYGPWVGYQSRGNSVTTRDVPSTYMSTLTFNAISSSFSITSGTAGSISNPIRVCNTPATVRQLVRDPLTIYTSNPSGVANATGQIKGRSRWTTATGIGNVYDTLDNKSWVCVCAATTLYTNYVGPAIFVGPYDGVTNPIP